MSALVSEMPRRNGWTMTEHAGDRDPGTRSGCSTARPGFVAVMSQVGLVRWCQDGSGRAA